MTDYAIDDSEYQRLQAENERLKVERDLAVRVAGEMIDPAVGMSALHDGFKWGDVTAQDIRKVLAWYREAQDAANANDDGAR